MQAIRFAAARSVDVELEERRRGLDPALDVHHVREDRDDPVGAGRDPGGGLFHDDVRVDAAAGRLGGLELAEGVAIPAHRDPAVEPDPLGHPLARDRVAERPDPGLGIDQRRVGHGRQLPEAAADEGQPVGPDDPDPDQAELGVGSADDDRGPGRQSGLVRRAARQRPHDGARLEDLRDDRRVEPDELEQRRRPCPGLQVEQVGARAGGRVGHEPAGQPVEHPVAEHADVGDRPEHLGLVLADPQEAGRRGDGDPVAGRLEDPPRCAASDEGGRLVRGARVDVRAGPDLATARVVQDHPLAHARAADRRDVGRGRTRALERLADALADQAPVALGLEHLRAGVRRAAPGGSTRAGRSPPAGRPRRTAPRGSCRSRGRWRAGGASGGRAGPVGLERGPVGEVDERLAAASRSISAAAISPP